MPVENVRIAPDNHRAWSLRPPLDAGSRRSSVDRRLPPTASDGLVTPEAFGVYDAFEESLYAAL
jgi:hypothetical protein